MLTRLKRKLSSLVWSSRTFVNKTFFLNRLLRESAGLHLGCGETHMEGFLNVDYRATRSADIAHDCSDLSFIKPESVGTVYSNAFLEHLYLDQRLQCLQNVRSILRKTGLAVFLSIPDFRRIAQAYLNDEVGIVGDRFDLYNVYRYTHGAPEIARSWYLQQLHKSLFDQESLAQLLTEAGFAHYVIFRFCFRDEPVPVNLGFVASKGARVGDADADKISEIVSRYSKDVNLRTVTRLLGFDSAPTQLKNRASNPQVAAAKFQ